MPNFRQIQQRKIEVRSGVKQNKIEEEYEVFEPYDYQVEASDCVAKHLDSKGRDFLPMATGLGKTRTSIEIIKKVSKKPKKILVLADKVDLLEQHKKVFNAYLGQEYQMTDFTGKTFITRKNPPEYEVVFATRQKMRGYIDEENGNGGYLPPGFFDFVLDDESHHVMAETYQPTLHYFMPNYLLGMTGTPDRSDWKDIREVFGESSIDIARQEAEAKGDNDSFNYSLEKSMELGRLTPVDYDLVTMDINEDELNKLIADKEKVLSKEEIEKLIFKEKSLEEVLEHMVNAVGDKQTGIMCDSIDQAERVAYILREKGYIAESFHSQSGDDGEQLVRFRRRTSGFLSAVNKMNEGIDVPEMEAVVFLRSTNSKTIFLQQLGRVLRRYPGKERALVLDYVGTIERLDFINQLVLDSESEDSDSQKDAFLEKKIHGGRNVFKFNRGVMDKVQELLRRNERRKKALEKKDYPFYSIEDTVKFIKETEITTTTQYSLFTTINFTEKNSPIKVQGKLPKLNSQIISLLEAESISLQDSNDIKSGTDTMLETILKTLGYRIVPWDGLSFVRRRNITPGDDGNSEFEMSKELEMYATQRLLSLEENESLSFYPKSEDNEEQWINVYGLHFEGAKEEAKKLLLNFLRKMSDSGFLVAESFSPEFLDALCLSVLERVHNDYFGYTRYNRRATFGPFAGTFVKLSEYLDGTIKILDKTESNKITNALGVKTSVGYNLWRNKIYKGNKRLMEFEKLTPHSQRKGLRAGKFIVDKDDNRVPLEVAVLAELDVIDFLDSNFIYDNTNSSFHLNTEGFNELPNGKIGLSEDKFFGVSEIRLKEMGLTPKQIEHVISICKTLSERQLYSKYLSTDIGINALVKYVQYKPTGLEEGLLKDKRYSTVQEKEMRVTMNPEEVAEILKKYNITTSIGYRLYSMIKFEENKILPPYEKVVSWFGRKQRNFAPLKEVKLTESRYEPYRRQSYYVSEKRQFTLPPENDSDSPWIEDFLQVSSFLDLFFNFNADTKSFDFKGLPKEMASAISAETFSKNSGVIEDLNPEDMSTYQPYAFVKGTLPKETDEEIIKKVSAIAYGIFVILEENKLFNEKSYTELFRASVIWYVYSRLTKTFSNTPVEMTADESREFYMSNKLYDSVVGDPLRYVWRHMFIPDENGDLKLFASSRRMPYSEEIRNLSGESYNTVSKLDGIKLVNHLKGLFDPVNNLFETLFDKDWYKFDSERRIKKIFGLSTNSLGRSPEDFKVQIKKTVEHGINEYSNAKGVDLPEPNILTDKISDLLVDLFTKMSDRDLYSKELTDYRFLYLLIIRIVEGNFQN